MFHPQIYLVNNNTAKEYVYKKNMQASNQFSHSVVSDSETPGTAARQASLSITNSWSLLTLMSIELVMPSSHLILCCPLLLPPSIFPSIGKDPDASIGGYIDFVA